MSLQNIYKLAEKQNTKIDKKRLQKAYQFAKYAHGDTLRHSGDPYITHPIAVAEILSDWGQDQIVLEAALLHDTVEDTHVTLEEIEKHFGKEVAFLVNGVTKVGRVQLRNSTDSRFVESLRKMFVAMAKDIRVVLIRLADRTHNMRTLDAVPLIKQERIAKETLEVYAPLAERLGMGEIKGNLEELAFPFAYPNEYSWLKKEAEPHFKSAQKKTEKSIQKLKRALKKRNIDAQINGRPKYSYSLFKKLERPEIDKDISKIHDLVALRIITKKTQDCYAVLGIVHDIWKPVPYLGISDFIAQPKPNGYQSIHTKVFDQYGDIIEIQIRTEEMHHHAEYGAAAHFAYSEAKSKGASDQQLEKGITVSAKRKMDWVKQLATWQQEVENSEEFVENLKLDALNQRIYVFSPLGDVYDLPSGATPIDFAYAVHTDLMQYINVIKVNDVIAPLDKPLHSGDVVEIIKSKKKRRPGKDWLGFAKTSRAKSKIKSLLNK